MILLEGACCMNIIIFAINIVFTTHPRGACRPTDVRPVRPVTGGCPGVALDHTSGRSHLAMRTALGPRKAEPFEVARWPHSMQPMCYVSFALGFDPSHFSETSTKRIPTILGTSFPFCSMFLQALLTWVDSDTVASLHTFSSYMRRHQNQLLRTGRIKWKLSFSGALSLDIV